MPTSRTPPSHGPLLRGLIALLLALASPALAHPMPSSVVLLSVHERRVEAEVQIPLSELSLALHEDLQGGGAEAVVRERGDALRDYLTEHVRALTPGGQPWTVRVGDLSVSGAEQTATGPYQELVAHLTLTPPAGASARAFTLRYDAVIHQVVTHSALVSVREDWAAGVTPEQEPAQVGVIRTDTVDGSVPPLVVDRTGGSLWTGFVGMFRLGLSHIAEGTDHLLFLLTLLLPAALVAGARRWGGDAGPHRSLINILRIVTAFTVGHSLTLIVGTLTRAQLPAQPIEALIAVSILISALHALRPLFPGREVLVAGGFGLIHGLAFSFTLAELNLNAAQMALSLLGFNLGIEAMQLAVIAVTLPWLLLLARTPIYTPVRVGGALLAVLASLGWLGQRLGLDNPLGTLADGLGLVGPWALLGLAVLAVLGIVLRKPGRTGPSSP